MIVEHVFSLGLHRIELEVYAFNPRARRVYEKVGFVKEGTLRDALLWDGKWVDAEIMSLLPPIRVADRPAELRPARTVAPCR